MHLKASFTLLVLAAVRDAAGPVAIIVRSESKVTGAWVPAWSRLLAWLAIGAGMT